MNDLALVHVRLDEDQNDPDKSFYWHRLALSHFTEAGLFLNDTADVPEVKMFVESLSDEAQAKYEECLGVFEDCRKELFNTRNKATFHYPKLRPADPQAERPIREALASLGDSRAVVRLAKIRDARALFADDVVAMIFAREVGGLEYLEQFYSKLAAGTTAFVRFANLALDRHFTSAAERGVKMESTEPVDPKDLSAGFKK